MDELPKSLRVRTVRWISQRRFGLSMTAAVLVSCVVIRYLSEIKQWWRANPDRRVAEFVVVRGGSVVIADRDKQISRPGEIPSSRFAIKRVTLDAGQLVDADLAVVAGRSDIEEVSLRDNQISDSGLRDLTSLVGLQRLDLSRTHVTATGTAWLGRKLRGCNIVCPPDDNLVRWAFDKGTATTVLVEVDLATTGVRGRRRCAGLTDLPDKPLTVIEIELRQLHDEGMMHFEGVSSVEVLVVEYATLTDAALPVLKSLKHLRKLELDGARFSDEGLEQLKQALPKLKLEWHDRVPAKSK